MSAGIISNCHDPWCFACLPITELTSNNSTSANGHHLVPLGKPTDPLGMQLPHTEDEHSRCFFCCQAVVACQQNCPLSATAPSLYKSIHLSTDPGDQQTYATALSGEPMSLSDLQSSG